MINRKCKTLTAKSNSHKKAKFMISDRQTDRKRDRQQDGQTDRKTDRLTDSQTDNDKSRQTV